MPRIFISYRHADTQEISGRIYDELVREFGAGNIFKDSYSIDLGEDIRAKVTREIQICDVLLAVIGKQWLRILRRRLDDPKDLLRVEISTALSLGKLVIPLLVDDAKMPKEKELPSEISDLAHRYALNIRNDPGFRTDMPILTQRLKSADKSDTQQSRFASSNSASISKYSLTQLNVLRANGEPINSVSFSPNGDMLASAARDNAIVLWEIPNGTRRHTFKGKNEPVLSLGYSGKGSRLYSAWDDAIELWETKSGRRNETFDFHKIISAAFASNGSIAALALPDGSIELWEIDGNHSRRILPNHNDIVHTLVFSLENSMLASISTKVIIIWNVSDGREIWRFDEHTEDVLGVAFSPNCRWLASASKDKSVRLWDLQTGHCIGNPLAGHRDVVRFVEFSPDNKILASASWDKTISLWAVPSGEHLFTTKAHDEAIAAVRFSPVFLPEGLILASASQDGTIKLWQVNYPD